MITFVLQFVQFKLKFGSWSCSYCCRCSGYCSYGCNLSFLVMLLQLQCSCRCNCKRVLIVGVVFRIATRVAVAITVIVNAQCELQWHLWTVYWSYSYNCFPLYFMSLYIYMSNKCLNSVHVFGYGLNKYISLTYLNAMLHV